MKELLKKIKIPALFTLAVWLLTLTGAFCKIGDGEYIHIGDALIYATAVILPLPQALAASVIGSVLADITLGSTMYVLPTIIIKTLIVLVVKGISKAPLKPALRDVLICLSGVITVVGYYISKAVMDVLSGSAVITASDTVIYNIIQALACAVVYSVISCTPLLKTGGKLCSQKSK